MKHEKQVNESTTEIKRRSIVGRYAIIAAVILFVALMIGSAPTTAKHGDITGRGIVWAVVSLIGVLALFWTMYVGYRKADERQQAIQLKAASLSFVVVLLGVFVAEMLQATITINLNAALQVLFIGGILAWVGLMKLFEMYDN